ncbi:MAG: aldose epimerase family protein, partial [Fusobacteriaceae bacterium]
SNKKSTVEILSYGGIIKKIMIPNREGNMENVILGFETLKEYENNRGYFGCITGRVAGRIKEGILKIEDEIYLLEKNNTGNHMHGGEKALNRKNWSGRIYEEDKNTILVLSYMSPHMENGYPGNVEFSVTYILKESELEIIYRGVTDRNTYITLTNHTFFNLSGNCKSDINSHKLKIESDYFLGIDKKNLPVEILKIKDTIFDMKEGKKLKNILSESHPQLKNAGGGLDHGYILLKDKNPSIVLQEEISGRILEVYTDQPSVVVYSGNYLNGLNYFLENKKFENHYGICLETQNYPDALNFFPEMKLVSPENPYYQKTRFLFKSL